MTIHVKVRFFPLVLQVKPIIMPTYGKNRSEKLQLANCALFLMHEPASLITVEALMGSYKERERKYIFYFKNFVRKA